MKQRGINRRRFVGALGALAGAGVLTVACGGTQPASAPAAPTAAPPTTAPTTAPQATAASTTAAAPTTAPTVAPTAASAANAAPAVTVVYWHTFFEQLLPALDQIIKGFKTAEPNVTINAVAVPQPDFATKITTAVQAGSVPDTALTGGSYYDLIAMKALEDVSSREQSWPEAKDVLKAAWDGVTVNGKIYAVPAFMFVTWMYYRKDWFDAAGITSAPVDWNAFLAAAKKLTNPAKKQYGFGMRGGSGGESYVILWMLAAGGELLDQNNKVVLNSPASVSGFQWYVDLFAKEKVCPPSVPNDAFRQIIDDFKTGLTSMIIHHTGSLQEITTALGDKVMTMPVPKGPARQIADVSPGSNSIFAASKQKDASWDWLRYWSKQDVQVTWLKASGYFPTINAVANDPVVKGNPLYKAATETFSFAWSPPTWPGYNGWTPKSVLPHFQSALVGKETAGAAVAAMATDLTKALS
jgi:multiple sugar transport system substrate-binding protein